MVSYTACYDSQDVAIFALKEEFTMFENAESISLADYAQAVIDNNSLDATVCTADERTFFEYQAHTNGKDYSYYSVVFKGTDAFWLIQFACETDAYAKLYSSFTNWAGTVTV